MSAVKAVSFEGEEIFGVGAVSCTTFHDRIPGKRYQLASFVTCVVFSFYRHVAASRKKMLLALIQLSKEVNKKKKFS